MFPDSSLVRQQVIAEAESWLHTPFMHNALIKGVGVGCGTLLIATYGALGVPVPKLEEIGHFSRDWHEHTRDERYLNVLLKYSRIVNEPKTGDMVVFRMGRVHSHSALIAEWPRVIHVLWGSVVQYAQADHMPLQKLSRIYLSPFV